MTIPGMKRAAALLVVAAALFVACGDEGGSGAAEGELSEMRRAAEATAETVAALQDRIETLETDLAEMRTEGEDASSELTALRKRLDRALEDLRAGLKGAKEKGDGAAASAASAAARAEGIARELTVLEDRFNFHLKSDHKGG